MYIKKTGRWKSQDSPEQENQSNYNVKSPHNNNINCKCWDHFSLPNSNNNNNNNITWLMQSDGKQSTAGKTRTAHRTTTTTALLMRVRAGRSTGS